MEYDPSHFEKTHPHRSILQVSTNNAACKDERPEIRRTHG